MKFVGPWAYINTQAKLASTGVHHGACMHILLEHQPRSITTTNRRLNVLSKAKSRFNILLNILQSSYIVIMFLRAVFSKFALQTIFFYVYHLKDDIQLSLRQTPEQSCWCSDVPRDSPVSGFSLHVHERLPSALWVVGSGSLAMLCSSYTHIGSALCVMVNRLTRSRDSATH